jgi:branched-chain amino acid transport system substrate-binding protein
LRPCKKIDYTQVRLLGGDTVKTTDMAKAAGMIEGIYATSPCWRPRSS